MTVAIERRLQEFFDEYAAASLVGDAEIVGASHFDTHIEAAPSGVEAFTVNAAYREAVAHKAQAMKSLGLRASEAVIASAKPIAPKHCLVGVQWRLLFGPSDKQAAEAAFEISYVVRVLQKDIRILMAISHEDEAQVLARLGLA
jgi:hypothetical protein